MSNITAQLNPKDNNIVASKMVNELHGCGDLTLESSQKDMSEELVDSNINKENPLQLYN